MFNGKNAQGLRGFPTPDDMPDDGGYVVFRFPRDNQWAGLILGAAQALTSEYNWYESGDLLPDEAADRWRQIVAEAPYNLITSEKVPTPYWDDETSVDDEAEPEVQPWYGYVVDPEAPADELTLVENIAIWAFTGFLAAATWEVGAAPAILFNTIAPKFVVAVRRGDLGEIIRILVDGEDAATVDTSSYSTGDVIEIPLVGDPEIMSHSVMLVQVS